MHTMHANSANSVEDEYVLIMVCEHNALPYINSNKKYSE